jgi:predicted TIM-barrel fold metal-dependent hydrolase
MYKGYKVADMDTHVLPSEEVLEKYVDPSFRSRLPELKPYYRDLGESGHTLAAGLLAFDRNIGEMPTGEEGKVPEGLQGSGRNIQQGRTSKNTGHHRVQVQPGVQNENAVGRIQDMDLEGRDLDLLYPGGWAEAIIAMEDVTLAEGVWRGYHRYMKEYCSVAPDRLKGMALLPGSDIEWTLSEMKSLANEDWLSSIWLILPENMPLDHPDLEPIWATMSDLDLPLVMHAFFSYPPYWPGYRDLWGNATIARTAAPPWVAARFVSFMICSGVFDRYPNFRAGVAEVGHGWLPHWLLRLGEQIAYVPGPVPTLNYKPIEYAQMGRIMCPAEPMEGPELTRATLELLGDGCLTHQSDYPHGEAFFPDTAGMVIDWPIWENLGGDYLRKYMWDNAIAFLRMS